MLSYIYLQHSFWVYNTLNLKEKITATDTRMYGEESSEIKHSLFQFLRTEPSVFLHMTIVKRKCLYTYRSIVISHYTEEREN